MIIGRIAFGIIVFAFSFLLMGGIVTYGENVWNGHDIPDWLLIVGCVFFVMYTTVSSCLILIHFGLL